MDRPSHNTIEGYIAYEVGCDWWPTTAPRAKMRREHADRVRHQRGLRDLALVYTAPQVSDLLVEAVTQLKALHEAVYGPEPPRGGDTLYIDLLRLYEALCDLSAYLALGIKRRAVLPPPTPPPPTQQLELAGIGPPEPQPKRRVR